MDQFKGKCRQGIAADDLQVVDRPGVVERLQAGETVTGLRCCIVKEVLSLSADIVRPFLFLNVSRDHL